MYISLFAVCLTNFGGLLDIYKNIAKCFYIFYYFNLLAASAAALALGFTRRTSLDALGALGGFSFL